MAKGRSRSPRGGIHGLHAVVVGLERRRDRWQKCERALRQELPWLPFEFFAGTDGQAESIPESEVTRTWNTQRNARYGDYEDIFEPDGRTLIHSKAEFESGLEYRMSDGERGCAHSHRRIWRRAAEAEGPLLVLEDDVRLAFERNGGLGRSSGAVFTARLRQALQEACRKQADVLYLGWAGYRDGNLKYASAPKGRKSPVIRKAEYVWTTVAYVLWPAGARKLLAAGPVNQPVDNFMAWEACQARLAAYVVLDQGDDDRTWDGGIVRQLDFVGDSDVRKSDGGICGEDPALHLVSRAGC